MPCLAILSLTDSVSFEEELTKGYRLHIELLRPVTSLSKICEHECGTMYSVVGRGVRVWETRSMSLCQPREGLSVHTCGELWVHLLLMK